MANIFNKTKMNALRKSNTLTDFTINNKGKKYEVHKVVLAASSAYFKSMLVNDLKESRQGKADLDFDQNLMMSIIDYMYTGKVEISEDNVEEYIKIADYLLIEELFEVANEFLCEFLENNPSNELFDLLYTFSLKIKPDELLKNLNGKAFPSVIEDTLLKSAFVRKPYSDINKFIYERKFGPLVNEYDLVSAVMGWCEYNDQSTANEVQKLLNLVNTAKCKSSIMHTVSLKNIKNKDIEYVFKQKNIAIVVLENTLVRELIKLYDIKTIEKMAVNPKSCDESKSSNTEGK